MPADLTKPFDPSCCDGGKTLDDNSAQPCGCDKGANWVCERHQLEAKKAEMVKGLLQRGLDAWQREEDKILLQNGLIPELEGFLDGNK